MSNTIEDTSNPLGNVQSHDWNKERLEQLKQLIPDLFTNDGKLNISELKKGELDFTMAADESATYGNSKKIGLGFKVFKLQKSNFPRVEFAPDPKKTSAENIELLKKYIKDKEAQLISAFNKDELITEILIKNGFKLNYTLTKQEFKKNDILLATDASLPPCRTGRETRKH